MMAIRRVVRALLDLPFPSVVWLLPVAFTLHNAEEWIWLPGWSAEGFRTPPRSAELRFALVVLTSAVWVIAFFASRSRAGGAAVYAAVAAAAIILLNVLFPHVLATVVFGQYAPGVVTAVVINAWAMPLVLRAAFRDGLATIRGGAYATIVACIVTPLSLPFLFHLGGWLAPP